MLTKSQATLLKDTYRGILIDAAYAYPLKAQTFERDYSRLQMIIDRNEGWFFTIFLPTLSKHLLRCIDKRQFLPFSGPHMRVKKGCVFPRLFSGLTELLFDNRGALVEDADGTPLLFLQTLCAGAKKLRMECDDATVRRTVESFVQVEEDVCSPTLNWGSTILDCDRRLSIVSDDSFACESQTGFLRNELYARSSDHLPYLRAIQSVSDRIVSSFGSPHYADLRPRHGPGAISDRRVNPSKYQFSNWSEKLEWCFPSSRFGYPNQRYWLQPVDEKDNDTRFRGDHVPSKLVAVPKTQKGPRLIAAEPVANMWMQQSLLEFLEKSIYKTPLQNCIAFRDQSLSGKLALESSLTRSHATIDLSDASDRLSCHLVERLFRSNRDLLEAFNAVRTDFLHIPEKMGKEFPRLIELKKFSTQGSALTFPVQTIVYAIVSIGVLIEHSKKRVNASTIKWASKEVRIFGDDIIVPNMIVDKVSEYLKVLGFKVNDTKTFSEGNFRESCGVDGYKGQDVTPAYILEAYHPSRPGSISSLVECSNNFFKKGFFHAAEAIKSTLPKEILKRIPIVAFSKEDVGYEVGGRSGAFGFISFCGGDRGTNRSRYNWHLHREEIQVLVPSARVSKTRIRGDFALHQYFTERPGPDTIWTPGEARRPKLSMKLGWVPVERLGEGRSYIPD